MNKTVGFIGLGNMGKPISANLLKVCQRLLVCDHHEENMHLLRGKGAEICLDIRRMAEESDVIFLSLPGPKQVREVMLGEGGLAAAGHRGQYIVDLSTVDPETSQEVSAAAEKGGILYVDAPVSGGVKKSESGTLTVMLGAREEEAAPIRPLLESFGSVLHFMGARGGGSAIKVINNFMGFAIQIVNAEALSMADHAGIDFDTFYPVVSSSSGGNTCLNAKKDKLRTGDIEASFTVDLVIKDLELAAQMCRDCGIPNFTLNSALQWYRMAQHNGYAKKDSSSVVKLIRELDRPNKNT